MFLAYLFSLPISGVWFLRYRQRLGRFAHRVMVRTMLISRSVLLERLLLERTQLLITIDATRVPGSATFVETPDWSASEEYAAG